MRKKNESLKKKNADLVVAKEKAEQRAHDLIREKAVTSARLTSAAQLQKDFAELKEEMHEVAEELEHVQERLSDSERIGAQNAKELTETQEVDPPPLPPLSSSFILPYLRIIKFMCLIITHSVKGAWLQGLGYT